MDEDAAPKTDLDGDTEVGIIEEFDSTEVGFLTPDGDVEGSLDSEHDVVTLPVGAATRAPAIAAVDEANALARHADGDTDPRRLADADSVSLSLAEADSVAVLFADADSVARRLTEADSIAQRLADADSIARRLADADSVAYRPTEPVAVPPRLTETDAGAERLRVAAARGTHRSSTQPLGTPRLTDHAPSSLDEYRGVRADESARRSTEPFWPPPGPGPAGAHGPRRKAQVFTAVEDETRDGLDSDQVTVVPCPDEF